MKGVILKYISALLFGIVVMLEPTIPFAAIVMFAIMLDCWSAFDLNKRLKKQFPDKVSGKFESRYALKMFKTFWQVYSAILLLYFIDIILLKNFPYLNLADIGAAVFCALQLISILENLSSANGAKWAKKAQRILVDKSNRHFDINLTDDEK